MLVPKRNENICQKPCQKDKLFVNSHKLKLMLSLTSGVQKSGIELHRSGRKIDENVIDMGTCMGNCQTRESFFS